MTKPFDPKPGDWVWFYLDEDQSVRGGVLRVIAPMPDLPTSYVVRAGDIIACVSQVFAKDIEAWAALKDPLQNPGAADRIQSSGTLDLREFPHQVMQLAGRFAQLSARHGSDRNKRGLELTLLGHPNFKVFLNLVGDGKVEPYKACWRVRAGLKDDSWRLMAVGDIDNKVQGLQIARALLEGIQDIFRDKLIIER